MTPRRRQEVKDLEMTEEKKPEIKWYYKNYALIIGFLCVGPFILPLVWRNPFLNRNNKIIITVIIAVLTCIAVIVMYRSIKSLMDSYEQFLEM